MLFSSRVRFIPFLKQISTELYLNEQRQVILQKNRGQLRYLQAAINYKSSFYITISADEVAIQPTYIHHIRHVD